MGHPQNKEHPVSNSRTNFTIKFKITFTEYFHLGTGIEKIGEYDSGLSLDEDGYPYIPDDTFKGLLRYSCFQLMDICKNNTNIIKSMFKNGNNLDHKKLKVIYNEQFKYATGDSLLLTALYLSSEDKKKYKPMDTYRIFAHTTIDSETGSAQDKSLYSIQYGIPGLTFKGEVMGRSTCKEAETFLEYGLKNIKRLGGQRNRGYGSFDIKIEDRQVGKSNTNISLDQNGSQKNDTKYYGIKLVLKNEEPISIPGGGQLGNLVQTLDYIPASVLMGALRYEFRNELGNRLSDENSNSVAQSFLNDFSSCVITNLYPLPPQVIDGLDITKYQAYPAFNNLRKKKNTDWVCDLNADTKDKEAQTNETLKRVKGYLLFEENTKNGYVISTPVSLKQLEKNENKNQENTTNNFFHLTSFHPQKIVRMRNAISYDEIKKDLFTVEYLKKDQLFSGKIIFKTQTDRDNFCNLFADYLPSSNNQKGSTRMFGLGRGRKPCIIENFEKFEIPNDSEENAGKTNKNEKSNCHLSLFCTSDLLLPLSIGIFFTSLDLDSLMDKNEDLKPLFKSILFQWMGLEGYKDSLIFKNDRSYIRFRKGQHFGSMSGIYGYSYIAIEKGSVITFDLTNLTKDDQKTELFRTINKLSLTTGIGDYTHKGFGQFLWNIEKTYQNLKTLDEKEKNGNNDKSENKVNRIELREKLCEAIENAKTSNKFSLPKLSPSQLGTIQAYVESARNYQKVKEKLIEVQSKKIKSTGGLKENLFDPFEAIINGKKNNNEEVDDSLQLELFKLYLRFIRREKDKKMKNKTAEKV